MKSILTVVTVSSAGLFVWAGYEVITHAANQQIGWSIVWLLVFAANMLNVAKLARLWTGGAA
jgi:hypothetical protein